MHTHKTLYHLLSTGSIQEETTEKLLKNLHTCTTQLHLRQEFFYELIYGIFFSDLGSGGRKKINKKALKMTSLKMTS